MSSHRLRSPRVRRRRLAGGIAFLVLLAGAGVLLARRHDAAQRRADPPPTPSPVAAPADNATTATPKPSARPRTTAAAPGPSAPARQHTRSAPPSPCRANHDAQRVIVSIARQHSWICARARQVKQSAVTTGASARGDATPTGTWHVQAKQTDRWLGADGVAYQVKYWMPYDGDYGFHDSIWQKFPYGSPQYRTHGSHGCVHYPLPVMKWLYHWADVGATVTVRT